MTTDVSDPPSAWVARFLTSDLTVRPAARPSSWWRHRPSPGPVAGDVDGPDVLPVALTQPTFTLPSPTTAVALTLTDSPAGSPVRSIVCSCCGALLSPGREPSVELEDGVDVGRRQDWGREHNAGGIPVGVLKVMVRPSPARVAGARRTRGIPVGAGSAESWGAGESRSGGYKESNTPMPSPQTAFGDSPHSTGRPRTRRTPPCPVVPGHHPPPGRDLATALCRRLDRRHGRVISRVIARAAGRAPGPATAASRTIASLNVPERGPGLGRQPLDRVVPVQTTVGLPCPRTASSIAWYRAVNCSRLRPPPAGRCGRPPAGGCT